MAFRDSDNLQDVVENEANKRTTLTEWFVANDSHASANDLLYIDFPERWSGIKIERLGLSDKSRKVLVECIMLFLVQEIYIS